MSDIGETIRRIVLDDENVTDHIAGRMHADHLPQNGKLPALLFTVVSTTPHEHLTGDANLDRVRIQMDAMATSRANANALARVVRQALQKQHRGEHNGTWISEINLVGGAVYGTDRAAAGSDVQRCVTTQDFFVNYRPN